MRGNGKTVSFTFNPKTNLYSADADTNDKLEIIASGYRFTDAVNRSLETFSVSGQLIMVADASGDTLTYTYSSAAGVTAPATGYLMQVIDQTGRSISFEYLLPVGGVAATDGMISKITNTAGQSILAAYDTAQNLQSLTWTDGKTQTYLYENPGLPWALTGIVDEQNNRYATFTYDASGHVLSTEHAGGVDKYAVSYGSPPQITVTQSLDPTTQISTRRQELQAPGVTVLTKPNGDTLSMASTTVLGYPLPAGNSQSAGSGCAASNSASAYDTAGNLLSRDDFQGQRTCYAYDANNQETTRIEGLGSTTDCTTVLPANATLPANARRISTTWHPDW
jgi:YD repeat-containing protein